MGWMMPSKTWVVRLGWLAIALVAVVIIIAAALARQTAEARRLVEQLQARIENGAPPVDLRAASHPDRIIRRALEAPVPDWSVVADTIHLIEEQPDHAPASWPASAARAIDERLRREFALPRLQTASCLAGCRLLIEVQPEAWPDRRAQVLQRLAIDPADVVTLNERLDRLERLVGQTVDWPAVMAVVEILARWVGPDRDLDRLALVGLAIPEAANAIDRARELAQAHYRALVANASEPVTLTQDILAAYRLLEVSGAWAELHPNERAIYARARQRDDLTVEAWVVLALAAGALLGGLIVIVVILRRGPAPVDPQAETLETFEPIEVDTEAITLAGASSTGGMTTAGFSTQTPPQPRPPIKDDPPRTP